MNGGTQQNARVMAAVAGASPWGLRPIARPVDVTDAEQFPEIAAAIEHARNRRIEQMTGNPAKVGV